MDEQGPAHKKIFYVKLKLGDEEYSASGESIKKAQHAAAAIALKETGHPHPPPKPPRYSGSKQKKLNIIRAIDNLWSNSDTSLLASYLDAIFKSLGRK